MIVDKGSRSVKGMVFVRIIKERSESTYHADRNSTAQGFVSGRP